MHIEPEVQYKIFVLQIHSAECTERIHLIPKWWIVVTWPSSPRFHADHPERNSPNS